MNQSQYRFTLDLQSTQSQVCIPVTRGDTARTWLISFRDGSNTYKISDGCLAKLEIMRPTGTHIEEFCPIERNTTVRYSFSQNPNTAAVEGFHECAVVLYDEKGNVIGSPRFSMIVSGRVINSDNIKLSDETKLSVDSMIAEEAFRQNAETERSTAEAERIASEAQRTLNETARQTADSERSLAEENRNKRFETLQKEINTATATLVSPTVTVTPTENGHQVKVTDHKGEHMFSLMNGKDGEQGIQGPSGKTAYQYAHETGYTGTEENYAEDMNPEALKNQLNDYLVTELAKRGQLKPEFANGMEECTDTSKLYVLPDGFIYAFMTKEVICSGKSETISLPLTNGIRISATDGSNREQANCCSTNWIDLTEIPRPATLKLSGIRWSSADDTKNYHAYAVCTVKDAEGNKIESVYTSPEMKNVKVTNNHTDFTDVTIQISLENIAFIRVSGTWETATVTGQTATGSYSSAKAVLSYETQDTVEVVTGWHNTGNAFIPADYEEKILQSESAIQKMQMNMLKLHEEMTKLNTNCENADVAPDFVKAEAQRVAESILSTPHANHFGNCSS